jgi:hypothetical protein
MIRAMKANGHAITAKINQSRNANITSPLGHVMAMQTPSSGQKVLILRAGLYRNGPLTPYISNC